MSVKKLIPERWVRRTFATEGDDDEKPSLHKQLAAFFAVAIVGLLAFKGPGEAAVALTAMSMCLGTKAWKEHALAKLNGSAGPKTVPPKPSAVKPKP